MKFLFEGLVAVTAVVGTFFLMVQLRQTSQALEEARTANEISRDNQRAAAIDAAEQRRALEDQMDLMRQQAAAAETSSKSALKSPETAAQSAAALSESNRIAAANADFERRQRQNEQRPILFVRPSFEPEEPTSSTSEYWWDTSWVNTGKTIARRVRFMWEVKVDSQDPPVPDWKLSAAGRGQEVPPGDSDLLWQTETHTLGANFADYIAGKKAIVLLQRVLYCDESRRLYEIQHCAFHSREIPEGVTRYCLNGSWSREIEDKAMANEFC